LLSRDLGYLRADQHDDLHAALSEVGRMLVALRLRVKAATVTK
jgi:hypothetical protein